MVLPYVHGHVRATTQNGSSSTAQGFLDCRRRTPNEQLMIIFYISLALHVFRAGVRRNNSEVILPMKSTLSSLFFGLNMPFYMEVYMYMKNSIVRVQGQSVVQDFIEKR